MKLIIHDLNNEKLENLKSELEKEDKSINIIKKSIDQGSIIIDKDVCVISNNKKIKRPIRSFLYIKIFLKESLFNFLFLLLLNSNKIGDINEI